MKSNKCPKCGFITMATAAACKNCAHQFSSNDNVRAMASNSSNTETPQTWADTFCALNLLAVAVVCGVIFCLIWNAYVLSSFLPSGRYPIILLIIFYLPPGILALICGGVWYAILKSLLKGLGAKVSEIE